MKTKEEQPVEKPVEKPIEKPKRYKRKLTDKEWDDYMKAHVPKYYR